MNSHLLFEATWRSPRGFVGFLTEVNNRPLGMRFMLTAAAFFLIGGILALLMRIQLAVSENTFMGPHLYNQLFTMHGSTMMFLFSVPFLEGLALYILPVMIGSRDAAFPRLSAFAYWTYLFGGIIFYASFVIGEVPNSGWFAYTPLSSSKFSGLGLDFWAMGLSLVELSGIALGAEIVITILKFRAPGMTLGRMPLFAWAMLAAGLMSIFAFTTLLVATLMLEMDRTMGTHFFNAEYGGTNLLWQHLFWFFGHPEVYIIFLPATGIVSMVVATFSRRLLGYTYIAVAILVTAFVSFGLWVHHMYATGLPELSLAFFAAAGLMIALASGVQIFAWIASMWGQQPSLRTPMMYVLGFIFNFVLGGMTGVMVAIVPFDWQVHDTYFVVAHFHYVLIGGAVFPILAGMYYWIPKFTGKMLLPGLGHLSFWLSFIGFNMTFFPMHIMGFLGMPRRIYTYLPVLELDGYNLFATIGAFVFAMGFLIFMIDIGVSLKWGEPAGNDPWNGETLEWTVTSPPKTYGFLAPPVVHSRHPAWDQNPEMKAYHPSESNENAKRICEALRGKPEAWRGSLTCDVISATPLAIQFMPGPSILPFVASVGVMVAFVSILFKAYLVIVVGAVVSTIAVGQWLRPKQKNIEMLREDEASVAVGLPALVTGSRAIGWWGMLVFITVLGTALGAMVFSYFYIRLYSQEWPQGGLPRPSLATFSVAYGILLMTAPLMWLTNFCFRRSFWNLIQVVMGLLILMALAFLAALLYAIVDYGITPRDNAFASAFLLLSSFSFFAGMLGVAFLVNAQYWMWSEYQDRDGFMMLQLQITSMLWYFIVAAGVIVYVTLVLF
jgi:cytochrome c oxidase subunit I+III